MSGLQDYDVAAVHPLRVEVITDNSPALQDSDEVVRIQAVDLRHAAQQTAAQREERADCTVLVDIEVAIAPRAHDARDALAAADQTGRAPTLLYVGTPSGLAGLITDMHALGIADGAVLIPILDGMQQLIRDEVLPVVHSLSGRFVQYRAS